VFSKGRREGGDGRGGGGGSTKDGVRTIPRTTNRDHDVRKKVRMELGRLNEPRMLVRGPAKVGLRSGKRASVSAR